MSLSQAVLSLDFAALRTLRLVYQKASFAAAADELGMSASSISYTIERVRKAAGDPLFLRQGGSIAPTDHCRVLMQSVERILAEAENIVDEDAFDPKQVEAHFRIYSAVFADQIIIPVVLRRLRREAPGITLHVQSGYGGAREALLQDKVDVAIVPGGISDSGVHSIQPLIEDPHLCMMDRSHPLADKRVLSVEDFANFPHVRFEPTPGWLQTPFRYAIEQGASLRTVVTCSDARELVDCVIGTDLLAVLPSRLAYRWHNDLALCPFDFPTPSNTVLYWTAASHRSKVKAWIRSLIQDVAKNLPEAPLYPDGFDALSLGEMKERSRRN